MLLETSPDELAAHRHELGDAELSNLESADACQELAVIEQLIGNEIHVHDDEETYSSAALDSTGRFLYDAAVLNNVTKQVDGLASDLYDTDIRYSPLACSNDNDFRNQLGLNSLGQFDGTHSCFETSQQHSYGGSHTEEVDVAVKQHTDVAGDMIQLNICPELVKEDSESSVVQTLSKTHSIHHGRDGLEVVHSRSSHKSVILHDSWCPGVLGDECCKDRETSIMHDVCSAESETSAKQVAEVYLVNYEVEQTNNYVTDDKVDYTSSPLDCENSKFMDIPVESRTQRVKLMLDPSEVEAICSEVSQVVPDQLSSLFGYILDMSEHFGKGFPSAMESQEYSDSPNAGVYASLGGMELSDDIELIQVEDGKTGTMHNRQDTETICDMNNYPGNITNITSSSNDSDLLNASIFAYLGGMFEHDDMELIPVDNEKTGTECNTEGLKATCDMNSYSNAVKSIQSFSSDIGSQDKNEQLEFLQQVTDSLEMHKTMSTSRAEEQLETVPRGNDDLEGTQHNVEIIGSCDALDVDDNHGEQIQPSDGGIRLHFMPELASVSNQTLQYSSAAYDVDREQLQGDVVFTAAEEVCDSSNKTSELTGTADDKGSTSSLSVSPAISETSITEMQNVYMVTPLETSAGTDMMDSAISGDVPEITGSYLSSIKNNENLNSGEHGNNTGCASTVYAARSSYADLEFHTSAGFSENSIMEHHPGLPLLNNKKTSSTVFYAHEDFTLSVYEQSEKQLELITADALSYHTQRLELDDLTLTVTCFIPEENEDLLLDDDILQYGNECEYLDTASPPSSSSLNASDPTILSDHLATYADNSVIGADIMLSGHRSTDFLLPYLMPIDESAEFADDANADINDEVHANSQPLQPADSLTDMKTEPSNNDQQKLAYSINASPTIENAYNLSHELSAKVQCDDDVAATNSISECGSDSSVSNAHDLGLGVAAVLDISHKRKSADDKEQLSCEESRSFMDHSLEGNDSSVCDSLMPLFSANQQDTVGQRPDMSKYFSDHSVTVAAYNSVTATDVTQVGYLLDNYNEDATAAQHATFASDLTSKARSNDNVINSDDIFMPASSDDATQQLSSIHSVVNTAGNSISDLGDDHFLDINVSSQNTLQGINDMTEHMEYKGKNSANNKTVGLDVDTFSGANTLLGEYSTVTLSAELKFNDSPYRHSAETGLLCEKPLLQFSDIHTVTDSIMHSLVNAQETVADKHQTTNVEYVLSQMDTNDRDESHSFASAVSNLSPVVVEDPTEMETEEPADEAVTDFESTLEQLHSTEDTTCAD